MTDLAEVYDALRQADAAGDTESAQRLADYISQQNAGQRQSALAQSKANIAADQASYSPTNGMSASDLRVAGMGKALVDLGRGAGQYLGLESRQDVADSRKLDAPLMATTAGKIGNFAGNVALAAPAAFIPGANTIPVAGLIGATYGALQPSESTGETAKNIAFGGGLGAGGQAVGKYGGQAVGSLIQKRAASAAEAQAENAVRDTALTEARRLGYKIPPATINQTSTAARAVESLAGKDAMKQTAAVTNQKVTNRLVRDEFGLAKGSPLSISTLQGVRKTAGSAYEAVKKSGDILADKQFLKEIDSLGDVADELAKDFPGVQFAGSPDIQALQKSLGQQGFSATGAVEMLKKLRHEASNNLKWNVEDPAKKALGLAQRDAASALEDQVIRHLEAQGKADLARAFDKARQTIAKTYSVQSALNEGSGNVLASKLAAQLNKGKPLSGNLEKIARFAANVDSGVVKEPVGSPGVSALVASLATAGGAGGLAMGHPISAAVAAGVPLTREAARRLLLTKAGQSLAAPSYAPRNALLQTMQNVAPLSAPVAIGFGNSE